MSHWSMHRKLFVAKSCNEKELFKGRPVGISWMIVNRYGALLRYALAQVILKKAMRLLVFCQQ